MPIEFRVLENCALSETHFRVFEHVSITRYSSEFRVLEDKTPIERILLAPPTYVDHSKATEVLTAREK